MLYFYGLRPFDATDNLPRMVIGLIGRKGSGKGAAAKLLHDDFGARVYRMSDVLRSIADDLGLPPTRKNLVAISETVRKHFGDTAIGQWVVKKVREDDAGMIVIDGIRRQADLDGLAGLDVTLVNITAPADLRFERIRARGEHDGDELTRDAFDRLETAPTEVTIREVEHRSDQRIENTGTLDDLRRKLKNLIRS